MPIGLNSKTYRNTASYATPTWVEFKNIVDLTIDDDMEEADVSTRGGAGFAEAEPTLRTLQLSFQMINKPSDADVTAIMTAYGTRASLDMQVLDGSRLTNGSKGYRGRFKVFSFKKNQELRGAQTFDVVMKSCLDATNPTVEITISGL